MEKYIKVQSETARQFMAEILGTFLLCLIGCSSVAQFKFFSKESSDSNFLPVHISFGLGAMIAVVTVGKVSGAHLNPAVSLAMLITGRLTFVKFLIYSFAQFVGAFLAAGVVFLLYLDGLRAYKPGMFSLDAAGIFATYPNKNLSVGGGFFDQLLGTAVLIVLVLAVTDKRNQQLSHGVTAFVVGSTITAIGCAFAYNAGYAINPARDFGPRLFTLIAGYGKETFTAYHYFFWIPIVAPMVGSVVGTLIYSVLISNNWS